MWRHVDMTIRCQKMSNGALSIATKTLPPDELVISFHAADWDQRRCETFVEKRICLPVIVRCHAERQSNG